MGILEVFTTVSNSEILDTVIKRKIIPKTFINNNCFARAMDLFP